MDPNILGGTPVFNYTSVPVQALFDYIRCGETLDEFLYNFPAVTKNQALEVLSIAERLVASNNPNENGIL